MTSARSAEPSEADRLDIAELTAKYAFYVDTFQIEPLMLLWTGDAVFDETRIGMLRSEGAVAIRTFFAETAFVAMSGMSHLTGGNIVTDFDGDSARGVCTVNFEGTIKGGGTIRATAYYDDVYARTPAGWKFKSRTVHPLCEPDMGALLDPAATSER